MLVLGVVYRGWLWSIEEEEGDERIGEIGVIDVYRVNGEVDYMERICS
jgi:hypothetical protein